LISIEDDLSLYILLYGRMFQRQIKPSESGAAADLDISTHGHVGLPRSRHQRQSSGSTTPLMQSGLEEIIEEDEEEEES